MREPFADAVVVAAGASRRMAGIDKLDASVGGRPLLAWTVEAIAAARSVRRIVLVTAVDRVRDLSSAAWLPAQTAVVAGGARRADSVRAGVAATDAPVVLVHDGARPMLTPALVDAVAIAAAEHGAAVPVVAVSDSLKTATDERLTGSIDRDLVVRAQTPQGARRELLLDAFAAAGEAAYSDEAGLLEATGTAVATVPGEAANLKVTEREDLELVRALALARTGGPTTRTGYGHDSHPFGRDDGLWLCGVLIDHAPRLYGHSDGDVGLHALATALLSASGVGDLGQLFPVGETRTAGVSSASLLAEARQRSAAAGWRATWAQVALLAARPRLGRARMEEMRRMLAQLLELDHEQVAISASTGNLAGPEGAGRVVTATALVTVERR